MTTSHRPTWAAAKGGGSTFNIGNYVTGGVPSRQIHEKDIASHAFLKVRQKTQGTKEELSHRDLSQELKNREIAYFEKSKKTPGNFSDVNVSVNKLLKDSQEEEEEEEESSKVLVDLNQFDDVDDEVSSVNSSERTSESDDEDAELLHELAKIKREREEERKRKEEQDIILQAKLKQLERTSGLGQVKRRWDEDVVFRNQAQGEPKQAKRFINDTIRNDFHRKFLNKYIQ